MASCQIMVVVMLALLSSACDAAATSMARAQPRDAPSLPHVLRPAVKATMSRHAEHAAGLTVSIALGDYPDTVGHVDALLAEPRIAAAFPDDSSTLNGLLPAQMQEFDERLRVALSRLRRAAEAADDELTLVQLAATVQACRQCHRALRNPSMSRRF